MGRTRYVLWAALPFVVTSLLTTGQAGAADAEGVSVYRPALNGESHITMRSEGGVSVYRGRGGVNPARVGLTRRGRTITAIGGGEQIWFVDSGRNRLINCRFRTTSTVGRDEIRCIKRRLP